MEIKGIDVLSLIESKPIIWDRTIMVSQRRAKAHVAWSEICQQVYDDYLLLSADQQEQKIRNLMKKWGNLRDNWLKRHTKAKKTSKRYVHADKLEFLRHSSKYPQTCSSDNEEDLEEQSQTITKSSIVVPVTPSSATLSQTTTKQDTAVKKEHANESSTAKNVYVVKPSASQLPESRHISFIRGVLPILESFNEDETFEFQSGVLNIIRNIRMQRSQQNISNQQISNEQINGQPIIINGHWAVQ